MKNTMSIKQKVLQVAAKGLRASAQVAADSQCVFVSYEPKIPAALKKKQK